MALYRCLAFRGVARGAYGRLIGPQCAEQGQSSQYDEKKHFLWIRFQLLFHVHANTFYGIFCFCSFF
jgi:hypothetical protein